MMAETGIILYLFVISSVLSQNVSKPVVHIVVMESTGAQDNGTTYFVRYLKPLLDLALDDARAMFGDLIDIDMKHVETLSGLSQIGALAAEVFYKDPVHVFFGPASNEGAVTLGFMALHWNLPVLTPRGNDMRLRNITFFPTVVALHPFDKVILTTFIMKLFDKYGWKHISLFVDRDKAVMTSTFEIVNKFCIENEINCYQHILSCFNCSTLEKELLESKVSSRVNLLLMAISDVRCLLIRASSLGMLEPDFVYILPDIEGVRHENAWIWRNNDSYDQAMNAAFRRVMLIIIKTPSHAAFDAILKRLNAKMFGNDTSQYVSASFEDEVEENAGHDDISAQQYILSGYYNSFLVYLTAVNETLAVGGNISDGIYLVKRMCNRTYLDGSDDEFQISDQANRVVNMEVASMLDEQNGTFETIADFKVLTETLIFKLPEYETGWLSDGEYVLDIPRCGYLGQYCVSSDSSLQTALIASFLIILLIIGVSAVIILRLRYIQRLKNLHWWRLEPGELQSMKVHLTRSALSTSVHQASLNTLDTRASNREPLLGFLKGQISQMHALPHLHVSVNAGLLKEFEKIRDINHPNLLRVLGACLEGDKKVIITEYCQKGTLQALAYLHKHPIRVHGRLTSEVCMIDSRFSVKVGYYGLPSIYGSIKEVNKSLEVDNIWLAPELAHCPDISTQKGDIYSLAVIMSEILAHDDISTISKNHSASRVTSAKRQEESILSSKVKDSNDMLAMEHLMRECLARDPDKRPSIDRIHGIMHALMLRSNQSGSLVDNLLQRLEKYSSNLERIVDEKVEELRQEKHKSEELLRQMLPTPVADRLKAGLLVEPEFYDCVTIYFSDIVGFTDICSMLEPVHIVKMLNDLYSCFDGIIEHFDVYKVETIGDAYMVVSGLPTRNGNEHARQIARMSLVLLTATSSLEPVNTPTLDRIKIRIGLNSGPVCAGVVGHKMPRYCLFGDAVNIASRMESNGSESKIHTSLSTAKILKTFGTFILESRGVVSIKGKGKMETFWLMGENV